MLMNQKPAGFKKPCGCEHEDKKRIIPGIVPPVYKGNAVLQAQK